MIRVRAPSRLHFGLLALGDGAARRFGGVGLMVHAPGVEVIARPAADWSADGPLAARALAFAHRLCQTNATLRPQHLTITEAPEHQGLGTGTQLGLAVAQVVQVASGLPPLSALEAAARIGRGRRSALGIHGFAVGGFLVEAGKRASEEIAPLVVRRDFPPAWRIVLVMPAHAQGLHGDAEIQAFQHLRATPPELTDRLCRLVLLGMLPALAETDLPTFGAAVHEFNARAGEAFAPIQGGIYAHARSAELIAFIREQGGPGVGQSSWGPAVFAFTADADQAARLVQRLRARFALAAEELRVTAACNHGATTEEIPAHSPPGP